jgi:glycosyltransferase involved in cell wall biosynthesis
VYNRRHFLPEIRGEYRGVRIVSLPSIPTKHLDTITHCLLSSLHALGQGYDIAYYSIVGNSPLVWLPRLARSRVLLNVDGQDWAREKWSGFARWYQRWCERVATRTANVLIADAQVIQRRYREVYGANTVFVPYGANVGRDEGQAALAKWGLAPRRYLLYVGRFVPENAIELLIQAFRQVRTDLKLVLIGDAPHSEDYKEALRKAAAGDPRIVFTGYVFGQDYAQLSSHAYLAVQPSGIDGTRPASLDQMGFGNCLVVRDTPANAESVVDSGCRFAADRPLEALQERLQELADHPEAVAEWRQKAVRRILEYFNWEWITDFYEELFTRLCENRPPISYDEFLRCKNTPPLNPLPQGERRKPVS